MRVQAVQLHKLKESTAVVWMPQVAVQQCARNCNPALKCCNRSGGRQVTCVTPAQFQAMVAAAGQTSSGKGPNTAQPETAGTYSSNASSTPPIVKIEGDNPAIIQVGATYSDLGATITGPQADLNLGIHTYVNGAPLSPGQIDTSQAATDTVDYIVTDQNGLTSTSTRIVIIQTPSIVPFNTAESAAATSTTATTTSQ